MLKHIDEFKKYVGITGFRNVKIENVRQLLKKAGRDGASEAETQFFNARLIATWEHLYFAALNALMAFENRKNISRSLPMETLLYASAQHQITKAMEAFGIRAESPQIAVLVIGKDPGTTNSVLSTISQQIGAEQDDSVLDLTDEKARAIREFFDVSELELETVTGKDGPEKALVDLVIERMALLATLR